ncbi:hypothetical protein [Actibacterium sp.]|uniref:hypothetical protein n=1 Tax=Actibacterium sp. TaxID=1872125 RepID=UPI003562C439
MVALTKDRATPQKADGIKSGSVAAASLIYGGAIVMRDAAGNLVPGQTALNLIGIGRAEERVDNSTGAAGDLALRYRPGTFRYANSAAADEITAADIGAVCYAVDDQTVAKTDGTLTRSPAGIIEDVDAQGVWVRFDEGLTKTAAA